MLRRHAFSRALKTTYEARKLRKLNGLESLEIRQLLSISPGSDGLKDQHAAAFVGPLDPSNSSVLLAQAPADSTASTSVTAAAGKQSPQAAAPKPTVGHGSGDHGGTVIRASSLAGSSSATGSGGGAAMTVASSGGATWQVGAACAPEGGVLRVPITVTGEAWSVSVSWGASMDVSDHKVVAQGILNFSPTGPATQYAIIDLVDDGKSDDGLLQSVTIDATSQLGTLENTDSKIYDPGLLDKECNCSCGCNNVEPKTDNNGGAEANSGQGDAPQNLKNVGRDKPHPIVSVNDTLTNATADSSVVVQTSLFDLSTSTTPLWSSTPVYYNPANYTPGQLVQFSTMIDGTGLADGVYEYMTTVTETPTDTSQAAIVRSYSNFVAIRNLDNSPYGSGWMLSNVDHLIPQGSKGAALEQGTNVLWFTSDGNGNYYPPAQRPDIASLTQNGDGTYTIAYRDQTKENFSASGELSTIVDANGNTTSYTWNADSTLASVTDQSGRTTTFTYTSGKLSSVSDFAGRVTTYAITGGQLTSITLPAPGNGEQQHVTTMTYDSTTGLLKTIADSGGTTTLAYNNFRQVTSITEPDQTVTHYAAPSSMSLVDLSTGVGTQTNPAPLVYAANVKGSVTDGNNHTSYYTTDPTTGETLSTTDANGTNTTQFQYDTNGILTQITEPPLTQGGQSLITTLHYDANGNLTERDLPDGNKETWVYDQTWNKPTKYVDPAGRETDYTLDPANGNVLTITQVGVVPDPNRVTTLTYTPNPTAQGQTPGGLVATATDPRGIKTQYNYNALGLLTSVVYAVGTADQASVSYTYDANDNPATYTDELNRVTNFTFDALDRLVQRQDPPPDPSQPTVRPVTSQVFDPRGNLTQVTDPLGYITSYAYDPGSDGDNPQLNKLTEPDPLGGTNYTITTYGHDNAGNLTTITDPMSRLTTLGYDADNQQTSIQLPNPVGGGTGGPSSSVQYDALGDAIKSFDFKGNETDYTYDAMGRVLTITQPPPTTGATRPVTTYTYNADGQVLTMTDPMNHVTQYQYNEFGELVKETLPVSGGTSSVLQWSYDADGNVSSYTDGLNHVSTYGYDNRNRKTSETDALSHVTHWAYDAASNVTSIKDPDNNTTAFVYDGLDRVKSETNQLNFTRSFVYDLDGNLTQETDRDGRVRQFTYDHLNRETAEKWMSGSNVLETFAYAYNADGQLTSTSNPDSAYAYAFDGMGRTTSVDNNGTPNVPRVVLTSQYDNNSNRTQLSATIAGTADFQNVYSYDALDRLTQLYQQQQTGGNAVATKGANLTYNLLGQLVTVARTNFFGVGPAPDIATGTFSYDTANRLTSIAYTHNGGTATDAYSWTYDNANRVATMTTTTDGTATYSYDNTNQVTGATYTTNPGATQPANETYSFDANGNRTNTGYSTGTNNQLSSDGTFNYTYDGEGNRTSRTRISNAQANDYKTTYTWDYRDRLTDVQFYNNSNVLTKHVHYTYDVFDHLIGKQVDDTGGGTYNRAERYVLDGGDIALQFNASGVLTERYLSGPSASGVDTVLAEEDVTSLTSPGTVTWPLTDNLGTARDIVDSTGAVIDHLVYNSFGQIAQETAPTVHHLEGYTGSYYDPDTGMVNDWHRWYDPTAGRWISADPIGLQNADANTYRYVGNAATALVDPQGLTAQDANGNQRTEDGAYLPPPKSGNGPTVVIITSHTLANDPDYLSKECDKYDMFIGVDSAEEVAEILESRYKPGSISRLIISGHGSTEGGVASKRVPRDQTPIDSRIDPNTAARISARVEPNGQIIVAGCAQAGMGEKIETLAKRLNHDIIVTIGKAYNGLRSDKPWCTVSPKTGIPSNGLFR